MQINAIDFTTFSTDWIEWLFYPFTNILGAFVWAIIFAVIIAIAYVASDKNIGVVVGAIFITFGIFGSTNAFLGAPEFSLFFSIIAIAAVAGLMIQLFVKRFG